LELVGVAGDKVYTALVAKKRPGQEDKPGSLINEYPFTFSFGSYLFDIGVHLNRVVTTFEA